MGLNRLFWKDKNVFLTGHTGFKGSWFTLLLESLGVNVTGYSLSPDIEQGKEISHFHLTDPRIRSYWGDVADIKTLSQAMSEAKPEIVFHLAAQALVKPSYDDPLWTYQTNVMGTLNLLEAVRRSNAPIKAVVIVTTDKCYENQEWVWPYREIDRLGGGADPYSSSKACAEIVTRSYRDAYFNLAHYGQNHQTLIATARAGNVLGGGDWSDFRLIPDIVRAWRAKQELVVRSPEAVRPWQHVLESLNGYMLLAEQLCHGNKVCADAYNFGPNDESCGTVYELINLAQQRLPDLKYRIEKSDFHEAQQLRLDSSKAKRELNFSPVWSMSQTIEKTLSWYYDYYQNSKISTMEHIEEYLKEVAGQ